MTQPSHPMVLMVADDDVPWEHRALVMREIFGNLNEQTQPVAKAVLAKLSSASAESLVADKLRKLDAQLKELSDGPRRLATFVEGEGPDANGVSHALVCLDDGTRVFSVVLDENLARALRLGDCVVLDGKGRVLLQRAQHHLRSGEEARLERKLDERHIEVTSRGEDRLVLMAPAALIENISSGAVSPGASIILNPRQGIALGALPPKNGLSNYRFLDKGPVPAVWAEKNIGAPPKVIREVADHILQEMTAPDLRRRYGLRRCLMKLLCGVSGSGKTLSIEAIHRQTYEIMSEVAGEPVDKLPPRVFRFRPSKVLSMWLGESDKNIDLLFDEIEEIAGKPFKTNDGREIFLPVLVILEEADGLGRARGQDAVYDRILTTALQRLDPNCPALRDKLVVFLATTNEPGIVDPAFLRRIGGSIENFGRLNRASFKSVLRKLAGALPAASDNGCTQDEIWNQLTQQLTAWLFAPNGEPGVVELTFAGSTTPVIKYRRDFLTGALIDRALQDAAAEACQTEGRQQQPGGITLEQLMRALDAQIRGIVAQLREQTVATYADVPDGVRVASLRRIPQPTHLPIEFQRH